MPSPINPLLWETAKDRSTPKKIDKNQVLKILAYGPLNDTPLLVCNLFFGYLKGAHLDNHNKYYVMRFTTKLHTLVRKFFQNFRYFCR